MKRSFNAAVCLTLSVAAVGMALGARAGEGQLTPTREVFESSIGGVIRPSGLPGLAGQGRLVYAKWCAGCHAAPFQLADPAANARLSPMSRLPLGTNILQQRYEGALPAALEDRTDLTAEAIEVFVRQGVNAMPSFRKTEISDAELAALSAYLIRDQGALKSGVP